MNGAPGEGFMTLNITSRETSCGLCGKPTRYESNRGPLCAPCVYDTLVITDVLANEQGDPLALEDVVQAANMRIMKDSLDGLD